MCRLLFVPENGRIGEVHMKNLAIILAACGPVIMALSAILLGYVERSSTEHMMCLADIILGFIMLVIGAVYLIVKRNIMK